MERFSCYCCSHKSRNFELLVKHVAQYHKIDPNFKLKCDLKGCGATFNNWNTFRHHVCNYHPRSAIPLNLMPDIIDNDNNFGENIIIIKNVTARKKILQCPL